METDINTIEHNLDQLIITIDLKIKQKIDIDNEINQFKLLYREYSIICQDDIKKKRYYRNYLSKAILSNAEINIKPQVNVDYFETDKIISHGIQTQQKTSSVLDKIIIDTEQMVNIGTATNKQLAINTEKLKNINKDAKDQESLILLSKRQSSVFIRKIATDKIILVFAVLLVLAIIAIIITNLIKN